MRERIANWCLKQWEDIRGNAKWDAVKFVFSGVCVCIAAIGAIVSRASFPTIVAGVCAIFGIYLLVKGVWQWVTLRINPKHDERSKPGQAVPPTIITPEERTADYIVELLRRIEERNREVNWESVKEERIYNFANDIGIPPPPENIEKIPEDMVQACFSLGMEFKWPALGNLGSQISLLNNAIEKWNGSPTLNLREIQMFSRQVILTAIQLVKSELPIFVPPMKLAEPQKP
jgi:hypothetical protein